MTGSFIMNLQPVDPPEDQEIIAKTVRSLRIPSRAGLFQLPVRVPVDSAQGCLLGIAVGDAIGLPFAGMKPQRIKRLLDRSPLRHRFMVNQGLISDNTEQACMTAQAIISSTIDTDRFSEDLAERFKSWLVAIPTGVRYNMVRSAMNLWMGSRPSHSGLRSADSGPAIRASIIGVYTRTNPELLGDMIFRSTLLTNNDTRALDGAHLIAIATRMACSHSQGCVDPKDFLDLAPQHVQDEQLLGNLSIAVNAAREKLEPHLFLEQMQLTNSGISNYTNHAVPAALYCWFRHPEDFRSAVECAVRLGGETDTVASIVGGVAGAGLGPDKIPQEWVSGLTDWPCSTHWIKHLAEELANAGNGLPAEAPEAFWPCRLFRNFFFASLLLARNTRRLLPPY
jgi:ADP-ribosylglycohydrolase